MRVFFVSMFMLGLGTSLHCVSMCGPLVLTYAVKGEEDGPWYKKLTPNLAYQAAKILSYMIVGLLLGAIGGFVNLNAIRPYVYYVAGVFMIILGLGMTGKVPWATRLTPSPPRWLISRLSKMRRKSVTDATEGNTSLATPITFGLMTGILPCGALMAAQVAATASGSATYGALGMGAFGIGTAPLMIVFGTAGSLIPREWKTRMMTVLSVGVIIFGLVFINRGLTATGAPFTFTTIKAAVIGTGAAPAPGAGYATGADGVVEVPLVIENGGFVPQAVRIPADTPVRLVVDRRTDDLCSAQIFMPQLNILQDLTPNDVTKVDIPATKAGTYTLTCGMSMLAGQLIVGDSAGKGGRSPVAWLLMGGIGIAATLWYVRRKNAEAATRRKKQPPVTILGFEPNQFAIIVIGVILAVLGGLAIGGFFS